MKDKHKRTILRLELEVEANGKELERLGARHKAALGRAREVQEDRDQVLADLEQTQEALAASAKALVEKGDTLKAKDAEIVRLETQHEADLLKAHNTTQVVRNRVGELGAELEDTQVERDAAQEQREGFHETLTREREEWRQERGTLQNQAQELEAQLHAARTSTTHARLGG